ncbi:hypothetical protein GMAR_ORF294 [Golden Marseillevirus]|uniref:hypothetical protein n=1 Tax=Golden Marseillevirus TaxID=1720526 RepID=UPI000877AC5F|nr:hypothetical protein GMAR_ORF294 [Golden Marseillevirus]ALX27668.1 hypothetical protein GMAR_ORF294 [Golden Marseillevirus]
MSGVWLHHNERHLSEKISPLNGHIGTKELQRYDLERLKRFDGKTFVITRGLDYVNRLLIKGNGIRKITVFVDGMDLFEQNVENSHLVTLPFALPMYLMQYQELFVRVDADDVESVTPLGNLYFGLDKKENVRIESCGKTFLFGSGVVSVVP